MLDYCLKPILKKYGETIIIYDTNVPCFRIDEDEDENNYTDRILDVIEISYVTYYYFPFFLILLFHLIYIYSFYIIDFRNNIVNHDRLVIPF